MIPQKKLGKCWGKTRKIINGRIQQKNFRMRVYK